ncbi:MAG: 7TM-DISM domain-containing protein, partial [Spirochaetia bacterium]|nr:7TM-DISM domain-containing protein [Spirochaetia bacterium]
MIRSSLNIFFLLSLIFILNSCSPQTDFEVNQGVIDLQNFDFKSSPAVSLKGEWEFYPEQLLEPEDFINNQIENKLYMYVPQSWDKSSKLPNQKAFGYGTYRLKVLLPDEIDFQPGFNPGQPATSYRLWINGEFLSSSGEVGTNPSESVPFLKPDIVPFEHKKGEIEIILQVSNYTRQVGGLWKAVHIGNAEEMNYFLSLNIATQLMFAGIFLFIAVQYFSFYIMRIRDTINLVFSILSFAFFMNALNLGEHPLLIFFPDLPHGLLWKFTFSSAVLYVSLLLWFS